MLKKEKKERVVLAKEHPLPKERMVSTIFDPRKLCIINAQRQPGKERGGGDIMENNGDVKTALSHQLASPPPPTLYYWWVGVVQSASRRNFVIQRYTGKNYPLQQGLQKIQFKKACALSASLHCLDVLMKHFPVLPTWFSPPPTHQVHIMVLHQSLTVFADLHMVGGFAGLSRRSGGEAALTRLGSRPQAEAASMRIHLLLLHCHTLGLHWSCAEEEKLHKQSFVGMWCNVTWGIPFILASPSTRLHFAHCLQLLDSQRQAK